MSEEERWKNHGIPIGEEAFEGSKEYRLSMQHLNDLIPAAAQWLLIADGSIFMCDPFPSVQNIERAVDGDAWVWSRAVDILKVEGD